MKLRLAITGSGGYLANWLIERLGSEAEWEFILGLDIRPRTPKVACGSEFLGFDLTAPWEELAALFRSHKINSGLHLAWQFNPIHDVRRHRQVDVEGSRNFFRAARSGRRQTHRLCRQHHGVCEPSKSERAAVPGRGYSRIGDAALSLLVA